MKNVIILLLVLVTTLPLKAQHSLNVDAIFSTGYDNSQALEGDNDTWTLNARYISPLEISYEVRVGAELGLNYTNSDFHLPQRLFGLRTYQEYQSYSAGLLIRSGTDANFLQISAGVNVFNNKFSQNTQGVILTGSSIYLTGQLGKKKGFIRKIKLLASINENTNSEHYWDEGLNYKNPSLYKAEIMLHLFDIGPSSHIPLVFDCYSFGNTKVMTVGTGVNFLSGCNFAGLLAKTSYNMNNGLTHAMIELRLDGVGTLPF